LTIHEGIDYSPSFDDNAKTVLPGIVESVTYDAKGYGKMVLVDHLNGVKTLYGHLSSVSVHQGQHLSDGEMLGKIGSSGLSTGKHLHFEIIYNNNKLNPSIIMAMAKYV
jgi:murein DD-endopeptidase MepM/ murein hydrolase activator NlpD